MERCLFFIRTATVREWPGLLSQPRQILSGLGERASPPVGTSGSERPQCATAPRARGRYSSVSASWRNTLLGRLLAAAHPSGGWGYRLAGEPSPEPTAFGSLALSAFGATGDVLDAAQRKLAEMQVPNGSVVVSPDVAAATWPTGLALLAWRCVGLRESNPFAEPIARAEKWLLAARGETFVPDRRIYGHDTTIAAWPWIDHTHSWVEPTSYAVLALRTGGMNSHPRLRDGVAVLLDRAIPGGGWNYGNRRMFGADLRPFPGPTGVALTALAAEHPSTQVSEAITYLAAELTNVRAPLSLAWGLIGLTACNRRPAQADEWLEETAGRIRAAETGPLDDALMLLAGSETCPIPTAPATRTAAMTG